MKYHVTIQISVGSNIENKYCVVETHDSICRYLVERIKNFDFIHLSSDPEKVNDGKKTSYLIKTDRIYSVSISEK